VELDAGAGITLSEAGSDITVINSGVRSLTAGTAITLSGSTGDVTVSAEKSAPDYWSLLTDPNPSFPDLVYANGDVIWVEIA
jgi:hypothetical protein